MLLTTSISTSTIFWFTNFILYWLKQRTINTFVYRLISYQYASITSYYIDLCNLWFFIRPKNCMKVSNKIFLLPLDNHIINNIIVHIYITYIIVYSKITFFFKCILQLHTYFLYDTHIYSLWLNIYMAQEI